MSASTAPQPVIAQLVETMRALAGPHPAFRPAPAKGLVGGRPRAPAAGNPARAGGRGSAASPPAAAAFAGRLTQQPGPASSARPSCHAEHAFLPTAADGSQRFGRYHCVPEAGEAALSPDE